MNFLLSADSSLSEPMMENQGFFATLGFGGQMFLIGMLTVFAVLGIIWLCLTAFKSIFNKSSSAPKTQKVEVQTTPAPVVKATTDEEIVAVIAAAIAAAESENTGAKFRVVSFRRK